MTPKQMYAELSKIAGHRCADDRPFISSRRITRAHLLVIQSRMAALLEKLSYARTRRDFHRIYRDQEPRMSERRLRRAQQRIEAEMNREPVTDGLAALRYAESPTRLLGHAFPSPSMRLRSGNVVQFSVPMPEPETWRVPSAQEQGMAIEAERLAMSSVEFDDDGNPI